MARSAAASPLPLEIVVPIPPSLNSMYLRTRHGPVLTDEARAFKDAVAWEVRAKRPPNAGKLPRLLAVRIRLCVRTIERIDLDNAAKLTIDGLAVGLGFNDCRIVHLEMFKDIDATRVPECRVVLEEA